MSDVTCDHSVTSVSPCSAASERKTRRPVFNIENTFPNAVSSVSDPVAQAGLSIPNDTQLSVPEGDRACQAQLVRLHPLNASMCDHPCQGKRIKLCQMLFFDALLQNGVAALPVQSIPVETCRCGKHRELYYAHRDALEFQIRECFGMGIGLALKDGPVLQCRDDLQARLLPQSVANPESLGQRSSSMTSVRSMCGDSPLTAPKTDD